jgi:hypothetical protein
VGKRKSKRCLAMSKPWSSVIRKWSCHNKVQEVPGNDINPSKTDCNEIQDVPGDNEKTWEVPGSNKDGIKVNKIQNDPGNNKVQDKLGEARNKVRKVSSGNEKIRDVPGGNKIQNGSGNGKNRNEVSEQDKVREVSIEDWKNYIGLCVNQALNDELPTVVGRKLPVAVLKDEPPDDVGLRVRSPVTTTSCAVADRRKDDSPVTSVKDKPPDNAEMHPWLLLVIVRIIRQLTTTSYYFRRSGYY